MKRSVSCLLALVASGCHGCGKEQAPVEAAPSASASASGAAPAPKALKRQVLSAEHRRDAAAIDSPALASRDVEIRRLATRALARIADPRSRGKLSAKLSDEDLQVDAWAAYGLGYLCKGDEPATVRALSARAASLSVRLNASAAGKSSSSELDPIAALADALGRCGTFEAEQTLRAWLDGPAARAEAAALGLGRLASERQRLDDSSIVALLDAASRPDAALRNALYAFTRLPELGEPVQARLLEVAGEVLNRKGDQRIFAVRALARAGEGAVPLLEALVVKEHEDASLRADAARSLARLGEAGQRALERSLVVLLPKPDSAARVGARFGVLTTIFDALVASRISLARELLSHLPALAELSPPAAKQAALRRRAIRVRCAAANLLAGDQINFPKLRDCDPDSGSGSGELALLAVLDRGKLVGTRYQRWRELCEHKQPVVRQAALGLIAGHPEAAKAYEVLAEALEASEAGTVASAASLLARYPDRAGDNHDRSSDPDGGTSVRPDASVVKALTAAFGKARPPDAVEVESALLDAASALQLLSLKAKILERCQSDNPTLRQRAQKALRLLGERLKECHSYTPPKSPPRELDHVPSSDVTLSYHTDAGDFELTLDPDLAPVAVTRVVTLAKDHFYDNTVIHRVVPGFVVQFGDPGGDGYGGADTTALRCETSPVRFERYAVGVALAGRDTGSSQIFVALAPFPHLGGDYPLIGSAAPGWEKLAEGDRILKVTVK